MLEFIVLGEVPGTTIIITYSWVIALTTILAGYSLLRTSHKRHNHSYDNADIEKITL